jgi:hypothetical protein
MKKNQRTAQNENELSLVLVFEQYHSRTKKTQ